MALIDYLSSTARSVIYTMTCAGKKSPIQRLPSDLYVMPSAGQRMLAARLVLEEAMEMVRDMGVDVRATCRAGSLAVSSSMTSDVPGLIANDLAFVDTPETFNLMGAIDGCIDLRYVATWALCVMGVPDIPHEREVNRANNAKFPHGEAIVDEHGKYRKPAGWVGPDHSLVRWRTEGLIVHRVGTWKNIADVGEDIVHLGGKRERGE